MSTCLCEGVAGPDAGTGPSPTVRWRRGEVIGPARYSGYGAQKFYSSNLPQNLGLSQPFWTPYTAWGRPLPFLTSRTSPSSPPLAGDTCFLLNFHDFLRFSQNICENLNFVLKFFLKLQFQLHYFGARLRTTFYQPSAQEGIDALPI